MLKDKVRVEVYEGDPLTGCCSLGIASRDAVEKLQKMLIERNETVKALREEFKEQLEIKREIVSGRRRYGTCPPHARSIDRSRSSEISGRKPKSIAAGVASW